MREEASYLCYGVGRDVKLHGWGRKLLTSVLVWRGMRSCLDEGRRLLTSVMVHKGMRSCLDEGRKLLTSVLVWRGMRSCLDEGKKLLTSVLVWRGMRSCLDEGRKGWMESGTWRNFCTVPARDGEVVLPSWNISLLVIILLYADRGFFITVKFPMLKSTPPPHEWFTQ